MELFIFYLNEYGIYIILLFIILEYSCFPLPSEIILPAAGAYAATNNLNVILIIFLSVLCGLIGSLICYLLGRFSNNIITKRLIRKQNLNFSKSIEVYNQYKNISVSVGRMIPLCRTYISFIAGLNKHNVFSYIIYSSLGITIWNAILILLGYNLFNNLYLIELYYKRYKYIILFLIILLFVILFVKTLIKRVKNGKIKNGDLNETRKNRKNKCY